MTIPTVWEAPSSEHMCSDWPTRRSASCDVVYDGEDVTEVAFEMAGEFGRSRGSQSDILSLVGVVRLDQC